MSSTAHDIAFVCLALVTVVSAILVVSLRNLVHSALLLGLSFVGVAGLYLLLNAEFIAAAQVLVYVGAITVLILFAIMLTRGDSPGWASASRMQTLLGMATAAVLFLVLGGFIYRHAFPYSEPAWIVNTPTGLGHQLLTRYIVPFEVASIMLLVAMVAAIVLARDDSVVSIPTRTNTIYEDTPSESPVERK